MTVLEYAWTANQLLVISANNSWMVFNNVKNSWIR